MRKPHQIDVSLDTEASVADLAETVAQNVAVAYILMKGFKTICSAIEHIVVTKVT